MEHDPLSVAASPDRLRALHAAGALPAAAAARALELATGLPSKDDWVRALRRGLVVLGAGLLLAGVIFFFAYNRASLGRIEKLGVISAGITAAALAAWQQGGKLAGEVALFAACVLVGALLAVYGQAYQTGADPYELFVAWIFLILPWVAAARSGAFFALVVVLINTAIPLWWAQVYVSGWSWTLHSELELVLFGTNVLLLVLYELWSRRTGRRERWFARALATGCLLLLVQPALDRVTFSQDGVFETVGLLLLVAVAIASTVFLSRGALQDLFIVSASWLAGLVVLDVAIGKALIESMRSIDAAPFLLMGLLIVGEVGGMVAALRWLGRLGPGEDA